ncbi:MAG TPA: amidohydrolase family protein [Acidimicrobiales bacterium]|nr:amidohydrolase family protein [Acidimicrobiales bacterium]
MTDTLGQVRVIDADTHLTERHDLWTTRAPAAFKDRVPHVTQVDGCATWVVEDDVVLGRAGAGGVVDLHGVKGRSFEGLYQWEIEQAHAAAYDPVARMELLDETGIWAQVIFPGVVGLGGQALAEIVQDVTLRRLCVEIFNDAGAELQSGSGNRLLPMAILPAWDVDACVAETIRAAGLGIRGVNMTSDPQDLGAPDLASRAWDPLWEACSSLSMPVHFHIGASLTTMNYFGTYPWASHDDDTKLAIGGTLLFIGNARVVVNIICSGMLDRFPELKIVSVESGTGWIPFILEALDYEMDENAPDAKARLSMLPSEYFKRQIYATTWFERSNLASLIDAVGEDNIMFETDFPHPTCLYPDPLRTAETNMRDLSPPVRRKILGENGAKLYRI